MLSGGDASAADINGPSERGAERPEVRQWDIPNKRERGKKNDHPAGTARSPSPRGDRVRGFIYCGLPRSFSRSSGLLGTPWDAERAPAGNFYRW